MDNHYKLIFEECLREIPMNYGHFGYYKCKKLPLLFRKIVKEEFSIRNNYLKNILPKQINEEKENIFIIFERNGTILKHNLPTKITNLNKHNSYITTNQYFTFLNINLDKINETYKIAYTKLNEECIKHKALHENDTFKTFRYIPFIKNNIMSLKISKYHNHLTANLLKDGQYVKEYKYHDYSFCGGWTFKYNSEELKREILDNSYDIDININSLLFNEAKSYVCLCAEICSFHIRNKIKEETHKLVHKMLTTDVNSIVYDLPSDVKNHILMFCSS